VNSPPEDLVGKPAGVRISPPPKKELVLKPREIGCIPIVRTAWIRAYRFLGGGCILWLVLAPASELPLLWLALGLFGLAELACITRAQEWNNEYCADGRDDEARRRVYIPQLPDPDGEQLRVLKAVILAAGGSVTVDIDHALNADGYILRPTDLPHKGFARCYSLERKE
jgi:hypothetical protein